MRIVPLFAAFAVVACGNVPQKKPAEDLYSIRQTQPPTGTNIPFDVATSTVSLTKRYEDLTPAELKAFRAMYRNLPEEDEPPYPVNGTEKIVREIAEFQQLLRTNGNMFVTVEVDANGNGKKVRIYRMPDPRLAEPVAAVLVREKYKPAKCSGQPCTMEFPFSMDFETE